MAPARQPSSRSQAAACWCATHVLQVGQRHLHHAALQAVRGNLQAAAAANTQAHAHICTAAAFHAHAVSQSKAAMLLLVLPVALRLNWPSAAAGGSFTPRLRLLIHVDQSALQEQQLTLVPWVRVTRVLPTLRVLNMLGALRSYLHQIKSQVSKTGRHHPPAPLPPCRRRHQRGTTAAWAQTPRLPPRFSRPGVFAAPPSAPALPKPRCRPPRAPVLLAEGVDTAWQGRWEEVSLCRFWCPVFRCC